MHAQGPTGIYGGRSAEARRSDRRLRLLAAARDIWGAEGWAAVTMRGVCGRAGLVDRYFYQSFPDRDALLGAVWDQERDALVAQVVDAFASNADGDLVGALRTIIDAVVEHLRTDPARARIVLGDHTGSAVLEPRRREMLRTFADLLVDWSGPRLPPTIDPARLRMSTLLGVGGFAEIIAAWNAGELDVDASQIAEHTAVVAALLVGSHRPPLGLRQ